MSVCVAIALAFAIRVDAIELFNTYFRDPNARNKVIEQMQAATAQYKAANDAAEALKRIPAPEEDVQKQIESLKKEWQTTIDNTRSTVKQYADLGLPIGWTKENATLNPWKATCKLADGTVRLLGEYEICIPIEQRARHETAQKAKQEADQNAKQVTGQQAKSGAEQRSTQPQQRFFYGEPDTVGFEAIRLALSLLLGGVLVGLGGPFWYDAVTGLTNIRNIARDISGASQKKMEAAVAASSGATPDRPQPTTPVGAFHVSLAAQSPR